MAEIPKRPVNEYDGSDFMWADYGPSLKESATNPNEYCFTLACDAELYEHEHAVAVRAVTELRKMLGPMADRWAGYSPSAYEDVRHALEQIDASGWKP